MIVIVDGGSTKCDWVLLDDTGDLFAKTETIGFNPNIFDSNQIPQELEINILPRSKSVLTEVDD